MSIRNEIGIRNTQIFKSEMENVERSIEIIQQE